MSVSSVFNRLVHFFLNVTLISLFFRSRRVHVLSSSEKAYCNKLHSRVNITSNSTLFRPTSPSIQSSTVHIKVWSAPTPRSRLQENSSYVAKQGQPSQILHAAQPRQPATSLVNGTTHSSFAPVLTTVSPSNTPILSSPNQRLQVEYQQYRQELQEIYSFSNHEMFEIVQKTSHCHELLAKQLERLRTQLIANWNQPSPNLLAEEAEWTAMEESLSKLEQKFQEYLAQQRQEQPQNKNNYRLHNSSTAEISRLSERQQVAYALQNEQYALSQKCQQAKSELEEAHRCVTDLTHHLLDILNLFNKEYLAQLMRNQKRGLNFQKIQGVIPPVSRPQVPGIKSVNNSHENLKKDFLLQAQELSNNLQAMCCVLESAIEI